MKVELLKNHFKGLKGDIVDLQESKAKYIIKMKVAKEFIEPPKKKKNVSTV